MLISAVARAASTRRTAIVAAQRQTDRRRHEVRPHPPTTLFSRCWAIQHEGHSCWRWRGHGEQLKGKSTSRAERRLLARKPACPNWRGCFYAPVCNASSARQSESSVLLLLLSLVQAAAGVARVSVSSPACGCARTHQCGYGRCGDDAASPLTRRAASGAATRDGG